MYQIAPVSALGLLPFALFIDGTKIFQSKFFLDSNLCAQSIAYIMVGGFLSFILILVEVELVKKTSALSLGTHRHFYILGILGMNQTHNSYRNSREFQRRCSNSVSSSNLSRSFKCLEYHWLSCGDIRALIVLVPEKC